MIWTHPEGCSTICLEPWRAREAAQQNRGVRTGVPPVRGIPSAGGTVSARQWQRGPLVCTAAPARLSFAGFVVNAFNMSRLSGDIVALFLIKCWIGLDGRRPVGLRSLSGRQSTLWRHWLGSDGCKMLPLTTARRDWMLGSCCSVALLVFCLFDVKR